MLNFDKQMEKMKFLRLIVAAFLVAGTKGINGETKVRTDIKGRLLTVDEGCGYSKVANTRIVGGIPARAGAWPWIALVGIGSGFDFEFECGGSLITSRHVLTAAHCYAPEIDTVRLGEHDLSASEEESRLDIPIAWTRRHAKYNKLLMTEDIAMVYLERDVEFTDRISPICLPISEEFQGRSFVGNMPFVAGWGSISNKGPVADVLQQIQVPVVENSQCKTDYQRIGEFVHNNQFSDRVICAGFREGGIDACDGDSGGPLMLPIHQNGSFPFYQIGIISWGVDCGTPNVPGVYANVQYYSNWINQSLDNFNFIKH